MEKQTSLQENNLDQIPKMSVYAILRRKDVVRWKTVRPMLGLNQ